jgi:hypothetical protein
MYFYCYDYVFLLNVYVWLPWRRFFRAFSSVVRQMPGWCPQRRSTARTLPNFCVVLCIVCFVTFSVLSVCICVLNSCHRVATQLQLNISYHITKKLKIQKPIFQGALSTTLIAGFYGPKVPCGFQKPTVCSITFVLLLHPLITQYRTTAAYVKNYFKICITSNHILQSCKAFMAVG